MDKLCNIMVSLQLLCLFGIFYTSRAQTANTNTPIVTNSSITVNETFPCTGSDNTFDVTDVCDGVAQCPLQDNEFLCDNEDVCSSASVRCLNTESECKHVRTICDGNDDCSDGSDELFCEIVNCNYSPLDSICMTQEGETIDDISSASRVLNISGISSLPLPFNTTRFSLLLKLDLSSNDIATITTDAFQGLTTLQYLDLHNNNISTLEPIRGLTSLEYLDLDENKITSIEPIKGLTGLQYLDLDENKITSIEPIKGLTRLQYLYIQFNNISSIEPIKGLTRLEGLYLRNNSISTIEPIKGLMNLKYLYVRFNNISSIEPIKGLTRLERLSFLNNQISSLEPVKGLTTLRYLYLSSNNISSIEQLKGLTRLQYLSLRYNSVSSIEPLRGLAKLERLYLNDNPIKYIAPGTFENLNKIKELNLINVELGDLQPDTFRGLTSLETLSTDDYRLCCLFNNISICSLIGSTFLDSCSRLMPNDVLRVALWLIGILALTGNSVVIFIRCREETTRRGKVQRLFIINLAIADFLMGAYMVIIASADIYYGHYYFLSAPTWRTSHLCRFAGFITVLSSESSVLFLTIITFDRFLCVVFPFGKLKFNSTYARVSVAVVWIVSFILSLGPLILSSYISELYGLSHQCVSLPLNVESTGTGTLEYSESKGIYQYVPIQTGQRPTWLYSIVLFLGVNLLLFVLIFVLYVIIFIQVKRSAKAVDAGRAAEHKREIKLAARMALIVGTDFCCWMPVIIIGILSQSGLVQFSASLYAWAVVFILPINSSVNPFLYTFVAFIGKKKHKETSTTQNKSTHSK